MNTQERLFLFLTNFDEIKLRCIFTKKKKLLKKSSIDRNINLFRLENLSQQNLAHF